MLGGVLGRVLGVLGGTVVMGSISRLDQLLLSLLLLEQILMQNGFSDSYKYVEMVLCGAGLSCFQGHTPGGGSGCDGAPLLPVLYVSMNLAYNISLLNLLRSAGKSMLKPSLHRLSCALLKSLMPRLSILCIAHLSFSWQSAGRMWC